MSLLENDFPGGLTYSNLDKNRQRTAQIMKIQLPLSKSVANRVLLMAALAWRGLPHPDFCRRLQGLFGGIGLPDGQQLRNGQGISDGQERSDEQGLSDKQKFSDGQELSDEQGLSDDIRVMFEALTGPSSIKQLGNCGTAMRFLTAYYALMPGTWHLIGNERMCQRPIGPLAEALRQLGADIEYLRDEGFPPLLIRGLRPGIPAISQDGCCYNRPAGKNGRRFAIGSAVQGKRGNLSAGKERPEIIIDCTDSSQFASALMMIGPTLPSGLKLLLPKPIQSKPYLELTASLMKRFGIDIQAIEFPENLVFDIPSQDYVGFLDENSGSKGFDEKKGSFFSRCYTDHYPGESNAEAFSGGSISCFEGDWSAAAFWFELMAVCPIPRLELCDLNPHSVQGDRRIMDLFRPLGVNACFSPRQALSGDDATLPAADRLVLEPGPAETFSIERPFRAHMADVPDLVPALATACALKDIPFRLSGIAALRLKESDRVAALQQELAQMGYRLEASDDELIFSGHKNPDFAPGNGPDPEVGRKNPDSAPGNGQNPEVGRKKPVPGNG